MKSFGSDNHSGIHPDILMAIGDQNINHDLAYGDDHATQQAIAKFKTVFGSSDIDVYFVLNGTGANILSLKTLTRSYNSIISASTAHINVDECGAPEKATGCKLLTVDTTDGKLTPELIRQQLHGFEFQHHSQPKMISISQPTELGTCYTADEIRAIADLAHLYNMYLHVDGSRLANAIAFSGTSAHDMITATGVDVLSFGGTKNGMMIGEAVIFFNPELSVNAKYERKQLAQLYSKMRFVAAQYNAYLSDDLWLKNAAHANRMAQLLASKISNIADIQIIQKVESNGVFAKIPHLMIDKLMSRYFFYMWDEARDEARWMCSFNTTEEDVNDFAKAIKESVQNGTKC